MVLICKETYVNLVIHGRDLQGNSPHEGSLFADTSWARYPDNIKIAPKPAKYANEAYFYPGYLGINDSLMFDQFVMTM